MIAKPPIPSERCGSGNLYWQPEFAQYSRCRTLRALSCSDASTRTTQLYDRRRDKLSLDEVERIVI